MKSKQPKKCFLSYLCRFLCLLGTFDFHISAVWRLLVLSAQFFAEFKSKTTYFKVEALNFSLGLSHKCCQSLGDLSINL